LVPVRVSVLGHPLGPSFFFPLPRASGRWRVASLGGVWEVPILHARGPFYPHRRPSSAVQKCAPLADVIHLSVRVMLPSGHHRRYPIP
jgi:hypothetical protein